MNGARVPPTGGAEHPLTRSLRVRLAGQADPAHLQGAQRYFKGGLRAYGLPGGKARIGALLQGAVAALGYAPPLAERLAVADALFSSRMYEECQAALLLLARDARRLDPEGPGEGALDRFARWLDTCVENWAVCDSLCLVLVAPYLARHPERLPEVLAWHRHPNPWRRRAACATLVKLCRRGAYPDHALSLASALLADPDELVLKAVGWLLREASRAHPVAVAAFLGARRGQVPRLVRQAATELLSPALKTQARGARLP